MAIILDDILFQSETAGMTIPEIDLELKHGTLGGRFTTLEGILNQVYEELSDKVFAGDSGIEGDKTKFETFLSKLKAVCFYSYLPHTHYTMNV